MINSDSITCSHKSLVIWLVLCLLSVTAAPVRTLAQDGYEVHGLEFSGNVVLTGDLLRSQMATKAVSGFRRKLLGKDAVLFSDVVFQSDIERLQRVYQQEGFLDIQIEPGAHEIRHDNRSIKLLVNITEGTPIRVRSVRFAGLELARDSFLIVMNDTLLVARELQMVESKRFRDSLLYQDQSDIVRRLENVGYPYAKAVPELTVDRQLHEVDIAWQIDRGPLCRFGSITVSGLQFAAETTVRKPITFGPGDVYSRAALEDSQRRIYGLSLFHVATINAKLKSERDSIVPVEIRIDEAPRLSSRIGIGYGREEKFRIYNESSLLGFMGGARQLTLYLKHSDLEPYHASLKLRQPSFLTSYTILEISPFLMRQREPAFDQVRYGGSVALLHQLTRHLFGSATYSFERINLDTTSLGDLPSETEGLVDVYQKSTVLFGLTFDNSEPMFSPVRGMYLAGTFTVSGLGLGSDYHYTRTLLDIRRYEAVLGMVLAGRVKGGGIRSTDSPEFIPIEDRFYSGGSASVRGWGRAELGPVDEEETPLGGNTLFESSVEVRYPVYGMLSGALFYDLGNVWTGTYSFHLDDLRSSAGLGLRFRTPIGPIRFDVAWPVNDADTRAQYHISVGEAF